MAEAALRHPKYGARTVFGSRQAGLEQLWGDRPRSCSCGRGVLAGRQLVRQVGNLYEGTSSNSMRLQNLGSASDCRAAVRAVLGASCLLAAPAAAQFDLVIGEERIAPGIVMIFEGAVRDYVQPTHLHLRERYTQIHIEARTNWDADESLVPAGTPTGGFVAQNAGERVDQERADGQALLRNAHSPREPHRQPSLCPQYRVAGLAD